MQSQTHISYARMLPALEELKARPQWVCWRKEERQGTFTKVPYNARTGNKAQSDNPATWASHAQAVQALRTGTYHGIGYVFHRDYTGIDLDHCVNPDGRIDPWAQAYLDRCVHPGSHSDPGQCRYSPGGRHTRCRDRCQCAVLAQPERSWPRSPGYRIAPCYRCERCRE